MFMSLKDNIKKILKEEFEDDFNWITDIKGDPFMVGNIIFVGHNSSTKNTDLKANFNLGEYNTLKITSNDGKKLEYKRIRNNSDSMTPEDGSVSIVWANRLYSDGYWEIIRNDAPTKFLTSHGENPPANDFTPYFIY